MPEKLYDAKDVAERYGVKVRTARQYMKRMGCQQKPLRVTASQMRAWDASRSNVSVDYLVSIARKKAKEGLLLKSRERRKSDENRQIGT